MRTRLWRPLRWFSLAPRAPPGAPLPARRLPRGARAGAPYFDDYVLLHLMQKLTLAPSLAAGPVAVPMACERVLLGAVATLSVDLGLAVLLLALFVFEGGVKSRPSFAE